MADGMTDYVTTRWYRAPELTLANEEYDNKIDVWSVGCIMAELYSRKPFLMGSDWKNQLFLILDLLAKPSEADTAFIQNENAKKFLKNFPSQPKGNMKYMFSDIDISPTGFDLLENLL